METSLMDTHSRRTFLRTAAAAGTAWTALTVAQLEDALTWAADQNQNPATRTFSALTAEQARALEAMTARILPSVDGRPGAREAGAVLFIDRSLATFAADQKAAYVDGVQEINRAAAARSPGAGSFDALTTAQQDEVLLQLQDSPFFQTVRFATIVGTFGLPSLGGNRDYAGWHMLAFEHQPSFEAPFGYYDAQAGGRR
jgi:gluconate 2-dehydrogenase gamma chain